MPLLLSEAHSSLSIPTLFTLKIFRLIIQVLFATFPHLACFQAILARKIFLTHGVTYHEVLDDHISHSVLETMLSKFHYYKE